MGIDCTLISDLHGHYPELEGGDLLIVAGDLTARDTRNEYLIFGDWVRKQKYKQKIVICGNHDGRIEQIHKDSKIPDDLGLPKMFINPFMLFGVEYLCDSGTEFVYYPPLEKDMPEGTVVERQKLKIWGSPWTLRFPGMNPHCMAFTVDTEEELAEKWALIPSDTDILVTHSPPHGILDRTVSYRCAGSASLCMHVMCSNIKAHIFGHIHESYGIRDGRDLEEYRLISVNASHVNERYVPINRPIRVTI